jgi:hypothetical protein
MHTFRSLHAFARNQVSGWLGSVADWAGTVIKQRPSIILLLTSCSPCKLSIVLIKYVYRHACTLTCVYTHSYSYKLNMYCPHCCYCYSRLSTNSRITSSQLCSRHSHITSTQLNSWAAPAHTSSVFSTIAAPSDSKSIHGC